MTPEEERLLREHLYYLREYVKSDDFDNETVLKRIDYLEKEVLYG